METVIVIIIVGLAAAYLIYNTIKGSKKENRCDNGCASCAASPTCDDGTDKGKS